MFLTCINSVAIAAALSTNLTNIGKIPQDVVEGMVHDTIADNNIIPLLGKRRNDGHNDGVRKKSTPLSMTMNVLISVSAMIGWE